MKEEFQVEKEISIVEIFRALLSKILYLILALLIGACAGGVYGYFTAKSVVIYGTEEKIEYYVNPVPAGIPEGESVFAHYGSYSTSAMTNIVRSLESERFCSILLDDMMGIETDGSKAINRGSQLFDSKGVALRDANGDPMYEGIEYITTSKEVDVHSYSMKKDKDGNIVYKSGHSAENLGASMMDSTGAYMYDVNGNIMVSGIEYLKETTRTLVVTNTVKKDAQGNVVYKEGYNGEELSPAIEGLPAKKYDEEGKYTEDYLNWISVISKAVEFSCRSEGNIAESSIYVTLSMNGDQNNKKGKETIEAIRNSALDIVPSFVSMNMQLPSSYKETKCEVLTLDTEIKPTNTTYASSQMTKLALIAGANALIIAAAIVIALHMSDKRLRDVDVLPKVFNVPLLGVIPTIDEEALKHYDADKGGKA